MVHAQLSSTAFAGLHRAIQYGGNFELEEEVQDDLEGEQEAMPDVGAEEYILIPEEEVDASRIPGGLEELNTTVKNASKGVKEDTDKQYKRLAKKCLAFLHEKRLLEPTANFFCENPPENAPLLIVAWIMHSCDEMNLDGTVKSQQEARETYTHAQKMRAAMTYVFGHIHGLGKTAWHKSELTGHMVGNPSVGEAVSSYMVSLRRRKVQAGETATSARAVAPAIMQAMYHFNHQPEYWKIHEYVPGTRCKGTTKGTPKDKLHDWGWGMSRRLLFAAYTIAFLCLLRFDEVLKIQVHDIEIISDTCIKLTLPFRKTDQCGEIQPFYLHALSEEEAHLCPVRALSDWLLASKLNSGYLFRRIASGDRLATANVPMTTQQFLELFRNNLLDIGVDPYPYGTHSFRRGGCQYLHCDRRWTLRRLCEWGGWSTEFTHLTIVKYLISSSDDPMEPREHFFNPVQQPTLRCFVCGRTCRCC